MAKFKIGDQVEYIGTVSLFAGEWKIIMVHQASPPFDCRYEVTKSTLPAGHSMTIYESDLALVSFKEGDLVKLKDGTHSLVAHRGPWTLVARKTVTTRAFWNVVYLTIQDSLYEDCLELVTQSVENKCITQSVENKCICELMALMAVGCKCGQMQREKS
jgi:hypothetical protein